MNSKRLWATAATIFALSAFSPHSSVVWAQVPMAVCSPGWEWNQNSLGQDPCTIFVTLDAGCRGILPYAVIPINGAEFYPPPQRDNSTNMSLVCGCDTVMYSLLMGCTTCQGAYNYSWINYARQCDNVSVGQYPHHIPQGTAIPRWAFIDVTTLPNQTFSDAAAISAGRNPEATPIPVSTLSVPSPSRTDPIDGHDGSHIGAVVGGVVGGVVLLILLAVVVLLCVKRRKQGRGNQPRPYSQEELEYRGQPASPISTTGTTLPHNPYNPGDPSTYPPPLDDGNSTNPLAPVHGSYGEGRYTGVPEL